MKAEKTKIQKQKKRRKFKKTQSFGP